MNAWDLLPLLAHFAVLSLISVGGGMAVVPDMHRYLVSETAWLTEAQFSATIALAQAAPGPNVLFVALMGWQVAVNGGQLVWAPLVATLCLLAMVTPSALLALTVSRWAQRHHEHWLLKAFHLGMSPVVIALLLASAWFILPLPDTISGIGATAVVGAIALVLFLRTRVPLVAVLLAGGVLGALGWL